MRPTPTERQALARARSVKPLAQEDAAALAAAPDLLTFARRHDRVSLAATRLAWAAEEWDRRELRLALYHHALRDGDRTEISRLRVTALDTPTQRIRENLTYRYRALQDAESAAFRLL